MRDVLEHPGNGTAENERVADVHDVFPERALRADDELHAAAKFHPAAEGIVPVVEHHRSREAFAADHQFVRRAVGLVAEQEIQHERAAAAADFPAVPAAGERFRVKPLLRSRLSITGGLSFVRADDHAGMRRRELVGNVPGKHDHPRARSVDRVRDRRKRSRVRHAESRI